jgi:hypothetical protein
MFLLDYVLKNNCEEITWIVSIWMTCLRMNFYGSWELIELFCHPLSSPNLSFHCSLLRRNAEEKFMVSW